MYKSKNNRSNVQTILPLDALLKEKENTTSKPTAIRSAGKVGKWGVTSFTSIRTAYSLGLQHQKDFKSTQNDIIPKVEEDPEPIAANKPRKFFKSRASIQTQGAQTYVPSIDTQHALEPIQQVNNNKKVVNNISAGKQPKAEKKVKKQKKQDIKPERPPERTSARNRNKCINYNEDDSASVSSFAQESRLDANGSVSKAESAPKKEEIFSPEPFALEPNLKESPKSSREFPAIPLAHPSVSTADPPHTEVQNLGAAEKVDVSPTTSTSPAVEHPKIVLRISKGRLVGSIDEELPKKMASPTTTTTTTTEDKKAKKKSDPIQPAPVLPEPTDVDELEQQLAEIVHEDLEKINKVPSPEPVQVVTEPAVVQTNEVEPKRPLRTRINLKKQKAEKETSPPAKQASPVKQVTPVKTTVSKKQSTPKKVATPAKKAAKAPNAKKAPATKVPIPVSPPPAPAPVQPEAKRVTRATRKRKSTSTAETVEESIKSSQEPVPEPVPEKKRHIEEKVTPPKASPTVKCKIKMPPPPPPPQVEQSTDISQDDPVEDETKQQPSVKLVISKKKGSIFKSRALVNEAGNKRHVYKHKWEDDDKEKAVEKSPDPKKPVTSAINNHSVLDEFDDFDEPSTTIKPLKKLNIKTLVNEELEKEQTDNKSGKKDSYMVIRNVKKAHQIQEIGEVQELDDDVEYILSALQPDNRIATRCLSALQLASKCITPAFRMHVRAHGIVTKFFRALRDAPNDPNLGLCTATVLFVLSQDTLHMDLDRDSLELMLNLLDVSKEKKCSGASLQQLQNNKKKVRELCEEIKSHGKASHLNLDSITIGTLAVETLLSLTSKRAGEWFKEELRNLGGIDHIMKTVCDCCRAISDYVAKWTEDLLDKLRKIERCLRVLENVTQHNPENQKYILDYNDGDAVDILVKFYKLCDTEISLYPTTDDSPKDNPGCVIREALTPTLKVLINLTHPFDSDAEGSTRVGKIPGIFDTSLHLLLQTTNYIPEKCVFDISILVLTLLINLTTHTDQNRALLMQAYAPSDFGSQFAKKSAIKALVEYFYKEEELAALAEKKTDAILDTPKEAEQKKSLEEVDETVNNLLKKAGSNMEHTMLASYVCILISHLIMENTEYKNKIRLYLHNKSFIPMANILEKYYKFMNLAASSEIVEHIKSTKKILDYLREID